VGTGEENGNWGVLREVVTDGVQRCQELLHALESRAMEVTLKMTDARFVGQAEDSPYTR
jgi:hypothetical protein